MQTVSLTRFLEEFPVFRNASTKFVHDLLGVSRHQAFHEHLTIYSEGDSCPAIAFLLSGEIRIFKIGEEGREITLYEIQSGETCILNATCILSGLTYPAHAVATDEREMLLIPAVEFRRLIGTYSEMRDFVFNIISRRLASVMALVEEIAFGRMDERLLAYLKREAVNQQLAKTHQEIASDLGTSREVVSRILKDFERRGMLMLSKNLIRLVPH